MAFFLEWLTRNGSKIYDFFGGTGSSVIAAASLGRDIIAFDSDERMVELMKSVGSSTISRPTVPPRQAPAGGGDPWNAILQESLGQDIVGTTNRPSLQQPTRSHGIRQYFAAQPQGLRSLYNFSFHMPF